MGAKPAPEILGRKARGMPLPIGPQASSGAPRRKTRGSFFYDPHPSQLESAPPISRCDTFPLQRLRREGEGIFRMLNVARRLCCLARESWTAHTVIAHTCGRSNFLL